jgi:hypothetical protein
MAASPDYVGVFDDYIHLIVSLMTRFAAIAVVSPRPFHLKNCG